MLTSCVKSGLDDFKDVHVASPSFLMAGCGGSWRFQLGSALSDFGLSTSLRGGKSEVGRSPPPPKEVSLPPQESACHSLAVRFRSVFVLSRASPSFRLLDAGISPAVRGVRVGSAN